MQLVKGAERRFFLRMLIPGQKSRSEESQLAQLCGGLYPMIFVGTRVGGQGELAADGGGVLGWVDMGSRRRERREFFGILIKKIQK